MIGIDNVHKIALVRSADGRSEESFYNNVDGKN